MVAITRRGPKRSHIGPITIRATIHNTVDHQQGFNERSYIMFGLPIVTATAAMFESYISADGIFKSFAIWSITGGMENHAMNATINEIHACYNSRGNRCPWSISKCDGSIIPLFFLPDASPSYADAAVLNAFWNLWPFHVDQRWCFLQRIAWSCIVYVK